MGVPTDTFETYAQIGRREDLSDIIYDLSPIDTPFLSSIDSVDATATLHEWQTDALSAAAQNFAIEGDDTAIDVAVPTVRLSNVCAISKKTPGVSGTAQAVAKAGRGDELEYQIYKRARELKRDIELGLLANNARVVASSGTAREPGGVPTWLTSNLSEGAGATTSTGLGTNQRTDGTNRSFTEAQLKTVLQGCWDNGGDPDTILLGSFNKQKASAFTGNATREVGAEDKKLYASIDVYDSDFGELQIVPSRQIDDNYCFVLQMDMWAIAYLRPFQLLHLAKTGDNEKREILAEYTLESRNELGSGAVYDLTSS